MNPPLSSGQPAPRPAAARARRPRALVLYASSETDANILYATRFFAPDPFLFVRSGRIRILGASDLEVDRARRGATVDRVVSLTEIRRRLLKEKKGPATLPRTIREVLSDLGIRDAAVPAGFPVQLADALRRLDLRLTVLADPLFPSRAGKSPAEVRAILLSVRAAEMGIEAAHQAIRRSRADRSGRLRLGGELLTSERLRTIVNAALLERGCVGSHTIASSGEAAARPHDEGSGPIRPGTPIIVDVFPRSEKTGYYGDVTRTFVKGRAPERLRAAHEAVREAQRVAIRLIRPGASGRAIHAAVAACLASRGFETKPDARGRMGGFFHGTGHGLGLDIHEAPSISEAGTRLRAGNVVTVEPGLYYPGMGGVRIEDDVLVERGGPRLLSRYPRVLEVP